MAPKKKNHVQSAVSADNSQVIERKLRSVYDLLDYGNYKKSLQEAEKVLKKHPASNSAKSLKGLSLIRLGRLQEGYDIIKGVHATKPSDESTLQVLTICYKELNKLWLIAELYESAVEQCPDNEEYLSHLFMAHVRLGNYKKQHQTAVKLHKLKPDNNPYYYWSIMSLILQAKEADPKLATSMLLPLAEKMARTSRPKLATLELNAEIVLLCLTLEKQGKLAETLEVLRGEKGDNLMTDNIFKQQRIAELLVSLGRIEEANAMYKHLLLERSDNWTFYVSYIETSLRLVDSCNSSPAADQPDADPSQTEQTQQTDPSDSPPKHSTDKCDCTVTDVVQFLRSNSANNKAADKPQRAPLLALLEIYTTLRTRAKNELENCDEELLNSFLDYCKVFGDKSCCYKDISKYFTILLSVHSAEELLAKVWSALSIESSVGEGEDSPIHHYNNVKSMQRHILYCQLERLSGSLQVKPVNGKISTARELQSRFITASSSIEVEVLDTEVKTCGAYLLLAVHLLIDVYEQTGEDNYIVECLGWLEQAVKCNPANHGFSLLQLYLYVSIGAYGPVPQLVNQMEIKQVIFDSMGYLYSVQAMSYGHYSTACLLYDQMLKYFSSSNREISDALIQCYKFGTFSKVEEFGDYQKRVPNSVQCGLAINEKQILDMIFDCKSYDTLAYTITCMEYVPETDTIEWENVSDNREVPVSDSWDQTIFTPEHRLETFNEQKHWLRVRNLTVRLIATSVYAVAGSASGSSTLPDLLKHLAKDFTEQLTLWEQQQQIKVPRFTTLPTRLVQQVLSGHLQLFLDLVKSVVQVVDVSMNSSSSNEEVNGEDNSSLTNMLTSISNKLVDSCKSVTLDTSAEEIKLRDIAVYITSLSSLTELLSFATIFVGVLWRLYLPVRQAANPRKKKQGGQSKVSVPKVMMVSHSTLKLLISKLKSLLDEVSAKCDSLSTHSTVISGLMGQLSISEENEFPSLASKNISLSYDRTAKEIRELVSNKKLFLDSLISS